MNIKQNHSLSSDFRNYTLKQPNFTTKKRKITTHLTLSITCSSEKCFNDFCKKTIYLFKFIFFLKEIISSENDSKTINEIRGFASSESLFSEGPVKLVLSPVCHRCILLFP